MKLARMKGTSCILVRLFMQTHPGVNFPSSVTSCSSHPSVLGETPSPKGNLCPAFRQIGKGQRLHPMLAFSRLSSAQNNPYDKVACSGVAYSNIFKKHPYF